MFDKEKIEALLSNKTYQFAYLLVLFVLIFIVAWKEGLKTWILSKLKVKMEPEEGLTSGRGEPDFWVIGSELDQSRREHMRHKLPQSQEQKLRRLAIENMDKLPSWKVNKIRKLAIENMSNEDKRKLVSIL